MISPMKNSEEVQFQNEKSHNNPTSHPRTPLPGQNKESDKVRNNSKGTDTPPDPKYNDLINEKDSKKRPSLNQTHG